MMFYMIIAAVLGGVVSVGLASVFMRTRPALAYGMMVVVPLCAMALVTFFIPPVLVSSAPTSADAGFDLRAGLSPDAVVFGMSENLAEDRAPDIHAAADITALQNIFDHQPDDLKALNALSGALIAQERYDEAIALIEGRSAVEMAEIDIATQHATAYFAKGLLLAEQQKYAQAIINLEQAKVLSPDGAPFKGDIDLFITQITKYIIADGDDERTDDSSPAPASLP